MLVQLVIIPLYLIRRVGFIPVKSSHQHVRLMVCIIVLKLYRSGVLTPTLTKMVKFSGSSLINFWPTAKENVLENLCPNLFQSILTIKLGRLSQKSVESRSRHLCGLSRLFYTNRHLLFYKDLLTSIFISLSCFYKRKGLLYLDKYVYIVWIVFQLPWQCNKRGSSVKSYQDRCHKIYKLWPMNISAMFVSLCKISATVRLYVM